jgi:prepilin-type N-terminal cleavage/methylation domain-containing protein
MAVAGVHPAFSLVELLIAMTLIAIVTTIAFPHIDMARLRVDGQGQAVRNVLMMAQRLAVTRGYDVVVSFDTAAGLLRVQEDPDADLVKDANERVTATKIEGDVVLQRGSAPVLSAGRTQGVNFTARAGGFPALVFHRDGSASEAGVFYLTTVRSLTGGHQTDARAFEIARATGRVQAYHYDGQAWQREK